MPNGGRPIALYFIPFFQSGRNNKVERFQIRPRSSVDANLERQRFLPIFTSPPSNVLKVISSLVSLFFTRRQLSWLLIFD